MSNEPPSNFNPYQAAPAPLAADARSTAEGDATGGLIPYKNPLALAAYYLAIFSLIPCIGLLLGIPAVVCGILGLRARSRNPAIKGNAHAYIGIILGGLTSLLWLAVIGFAVFVAIASSSEW
jgi:hypothetical protein